MDHNKILKQIALKVLKPYGIIQKGSSRLFIDDHGWYLILIEFQPSGWGKGTYLNIGIHFNWYLDEHFSFTIGDRENNFIEFIDKEQFSEKANELCQNTIKKVLYYRNELKSINEIEKKLDKIFKNSGSADFWKNYHKGIISGLAGNINNLNRYFDKILKPVYPDSTEWFNNFKIYVSELKNIANVDKNKFKERIIHIIREARKLKKLNEQEIVLE
jgi:hypothetical protein